MFKYTKQLIICTFAAVLLAACGGSSDGGGASPGPAVSNLRITFNAVKTTIPANTNDYPILLDSPFLTQITVTVTFDNGTPVPDTTNIQLSTSDVQVAPISTLDDPETTDINEFTTFFGSVGNEASGGDGTFFIHGVSAGTVVLTASAVDPQTGRTSRATFNYTVTPGPEPFERLSIEAVTQTLPANVFSLTPRQAFGSVYMTEATISFRDPLGNFVNPASDGDTSTVGVSINPVLVAAFSTLDDPDTQPDDDPLTEENEIFILLGSGPVDMVAGKGTIFVWADQPGVATVTVTANDQFTGQDISTQMDFTIEGGVVGGPTSISLSGSGVNYVNGSGGSQSQVIQAFVNATQTVPVPNPNGVNNVMIDITTDGQNSGEKITGVNAQGATVEGQSINLGSVNGVASFQLLSGNAPNTVIMTATTDRADNNVDNGLQDPITAQDSFVISDGVLFGLDITIPNLNALFVNNVDDGATPQNGLGNLDGSYSITISAIGTDKGGNPALPQTVQFGLIDSPIVGFPQDGPGTFVNSGLDGDPQEGGSIFDATTGAFLTAGGGTQPGDTLMVYAEDILGNEDLESAVTVQSVQSETRLTISENFNRNDLTGTVVNDLDIFPYIIGRAVDGNIDATGVIDANGVVSTQLNYPVSKLGKIAAIYAKGQGATTNGVTRSVTDVETIIYPGASSISGTNLSPTLIASPAIIPANQGSIVTVCFFDAASHPIQGASIDWSFVGGSGTGSIDGINDTGTMVNRTGADGCAQGMANVAGVVESSAMNGFIFNVGATSCVQNTDEVCIQVADPGAVYLVASPAFHVFGGTKIIDLFLFGSDGAGIPDVPIFVECESSGGVISVISPPAATDENGASEATINAQVDGFNESFTGTCTFSVGSGEPSTVVQFQGVDLCEGFVSPDGPPQCNP